MRNDGGESGDSQTLRDTIIKVADVVGHQSRSDDAGRANSVHDFSVFLL